MTKEQQIPAAVLRRDDEGGPLPQMVAQRREQLRQDREAPPSSNRQLFPNANRRVSFGCFWQGGCSDSARCNAHGSCVAASQAGGATFPQQMEPDNRPLSHMEILSAVAHHASEIARLTVAIPVQCKPDETSALPHASAALKDFMAHMGEIMSMEDGAAPTDYLQRARDIREWCHDHQTLPKLEYSEHCGFCVRNKITVEVFGRPVVEPTPPITVATLHATTGMVQIGPERSPENGSEK